ncbi:flagellar filament capping protein FliD [Shouchella shacheensis]|uniref:flagellar filament capping protein FliD n=1 Tax=Shouchella shacheensis TaxID=1649580 RepID=UPI0007401754|nr:flagellar filament capping protein FliD [Shouchella shacheensis]
MRLSGMSSGLDIDQMMKDLMRAERMPVNKLEKQRTEIGWKMDAYREINIKMRAFHSNIFDTVMRSSQMQKRSVNSSNPSIASATASSNVGNTSFTLNKVNQLATAATAEGDPLTAEKGGGVNESSSLKELSGDMNWVKGSLHKETHQVDNDGAFYLNHEALTSIDQAVVKVDGKTYEVVTATGDLNDDQVLITEEGKVQFKQGAVAEGASVEVTYLNEYAQRSVNIPEPDEDGVREIQLAQGLENIKLYANGEEVSTDSFDYSDGKLTIHTGVELEGPVTYRYTDQTEYTKSSVRSVNADGKEDESSFFFRSTDSLATVMRTMRDSDAGVNVFFDDFSQKLVVTRKETGAFPGVEGDTSSQLSFSGDLFAGVFGLNNNVTAGQNAQFKLNGIETERRSNSFSISGMSITLKDVSGGPVTLSASVDTDSVFDTIKGFVDEYNEMLELVHGRLGETYYRDFDPLTDEERDALSETEAKRWDERAQSGMLRNDAMLRGQLERMRQGLYTNVLGDGTFTHLSQIGITTSRDYNEGGKLVIDEDQLRAAIEEDVDGVYTLFSGDGSTSAEKGIARRMRDDLQQGMSAIARRAGGSEGFHQNHQFTLGRETSSVDDRISNFERQLEQKEARYWRQFTAMEQAMQRANQQSESLYNLLYAGL